MFPTDILFYILFAVITLALSAYFTLLVMIKPSREAKLMEYLGKKKSSSNKINQQQLKLEEKSQENLKKHTQEAKECPHYVGFLTSLPKGSTFPDECFGCRKVIKCLRVEPTKVIESFYMGSPKQTHAQ